jgi:hypothetical protein
MCDSLGQGFFGCTFPPPSLAKFTLPLPHLIPLPSLSPAMGMAKALEEAGLTEQDIELKVVYLVGLWLECVLYGM